MDRAGAYKSAVEQEIPHADIVYDKFHIIKNYLNQVIDAVRRKASRGAVGKMKEIIKGQICFAGGKYPSTYAVSKRWRIQSEWKSGSLVYNAVIKS